MKVVKQGVLLFSPDGSIFVTGWSLDGEGERFRDHAALMRAAHSAALNHIADSLGLRQPVRREPVERISLDVERAAADAIAIARWSDQ